MGVWVDNRYLGDVVTCISAFAWPRLSRICSACRWLLRQLSKAVTSAALGFVEREREFPNLPKELVT